LSTAIDVISELLNDEIENYNIQYGCNSDALTLTNKPSNSSSTQNDDIQTEPLNYDNNYYGMNITEMNNDSNNFMSNHDVKYIEKCSENVMFVPNTTIENKWNNNNNNINYEFLNNCNDNNYQCQPYQGNHKSECIKNFRRFDPIECPWRELQQCKSIIFQLYKKVEFLHQCLDNEMNFEKNNNNNFEFDNKSCNKKEKNIHIL